MSNVSARIESAERYFGNEYLAGEARVLRKNNVSEKWLSVLRQYAK